MIKISITGLVNTVKSLGALALLAIVSVGQKASAQTFDFASSTEYSGQLRDELLSQAFIIGLATVGAFIGFALVFMAGNYVWKKFQKMTKIRGQL